MQHTSVFFFKIVLLIIFALQNGGCSSVGRAPDCGSGCRGFEPRLPPLF